MAGMTRSRYRFCESEVHHFVTCTIVGWLPVFTRAEAVDIVYESWRYLQQNQGSTQRGRGHIRLLPGR
jgi:putative transposase